MTIHRAFLLLGSELLECRRKLSYRFDRFGHWAMLASPYVKEIWVWYGFKFVCYILTPQLKLSAPPAATIYTTRLFLFWRDRPQALKLIHHCRVRMCRMLMKTSFQEVTSPELVGRRLRPSWWSDAHMLRWIFDCTDTYHASDLVESGKKVLVLVCWRTKSKSLIGLARLSRA